MKLVNKHFCLKEYAKVLKVKLIENVATKKSTLLTRVTVYEARRAEQKYTVTHGKKVDLLTVEYVHYISYIAFLTQDGH